MDPDAEKYYSTTPYHYCGNNPLNFADPAGKRRYRLNAASGSLTREDDTEEDEDVIEVWKLKPMISQGSNFMDVKINLRPQYEKGGSLTVPSGILPASQGDIKYKGFTAEGNLKGGLKVMNFRSMNSNLELNAWAFSDEVGLEGVKVNSWFDSSFSRSAEEKPESIPGKKLYNVHTHPGNGNGIGGEGSPSKSDDSNKGLHPYIPHYIISRNQGLTETQLNRTYNVPRRSTTHPSLRKYIK